MEDDGDVVSIDVVGGGGESGSGSPLRRVKESLWSWVECQPCV
jgi:hypothetical protein